MARSLNRRGVAATMLLMIGILGACGSSSTPTTQSGLDARKVVLGGLEIIAKPTQVDASGAVFDIAFDTHTGAPEIDVAANASLTVKGVTWTSPAWSGDGPGGHHRAGTLRFTPAGPATGQVLLTITGLPGPVSATWELPSP